MEFESNAGSHARLKSILEQPSSGTMIYLKPMDWEQAFY